MKENIIPTQEDDKKVILDASTITTIENVDKSQEILEMANYLKEGLRLIKYSIEILKGENLTRDEVIKRAYYIFRYSQESLNKSQEFLNLNKLDKDKIIKDKPDISLYVFDAIHTLKNDFSQTYSLSELIKDEETDQETLKEYLGIMEISINQANMIIDRLSNFDNFLEDRININLNIEVRNLIKELEGKASLKKIEVINIIDSNISIDTYIYKLKSILLNLISNAIKFTNNNGKIEVLSEKKDDMIEISIKDDGVGLAEDRKNKLFDNIGVSTKGTNNEEGTGFGLSICKTMAEKMGGDLRVESEGEGKGTTFILTLPIEGKNKE